jgi:curved DNA-binding protein CbpA
MNCNTDYYAILGVLPSAEEIVIRAAYKALAQRYHPDRFKGSPEDLHRKMSEINEAYSILSDPAKRKEYDTRRSRVSEGDPYFNEKPNDAPPEYDPLEQDWRTALGYYPDLKEIENNLARIAWRLAYAYRASLLETKAFDKRKEIAELLEQNFLKSYFGNNQRILDFAKKLIAKRRKDAARELNKAVRFFGDRIDAERVIHKINEDFNDPLGEIKEKQAPSSASPASTPSYKKDMSPLLLGLVGIVFLSLINWDHNSLRTKDEGWMNNVKQVRDSIASGQLNVINASSKYFSRKDGASIYQQNNFGGEPLSTAAIAELEKENVWWIENNEFYVRVKNNSKKPLSSILFEFSYESCSVQNTSFKEYHLFVFDKPIAPYTQSVVKTKPNLFHTGELKNKILCGVIVSAW